MLKQTLCVAIAWGGIVQVVAADQEQQRARWLLTAEIAFAPCVFSGAEFPPCDFVSKGAAREFLGHYSISSQFFSADYDVVEKPTAAGRYGAVVTIKAEDGRLYTRYRTLYKTPQDTRNPFGRLDGEIVFSETTGVAPPTWQAQRQLTNEFLTRALRRDVVRSHDFAVLLAGLAELDDTHEPASQLESAATKDRQWWLKLKRELNGNASRFQETIAVPQVVDGFHAPTLRQGTWKEAGMTPESVDEIDAVLQEWSLNSDEPFNVCVARHGVLFFDKAYGRRASEAITTDTRHVVFSITKALSGALLMAFVQQGSVQLDDPVENFLPEFDHRGVETPATLKHLFTHTADMDGHFTDGWNDLEHIYGEAYAQLAIGKQHRYNGTSIAVGLKVLEQLTGLTLPELYQKHLFEPLGCESIESIDGSAMTWSHARDLARFGQMLANHGTYGNLQFLDEGTFAQMLPRKLDDLLGPQTDVTWGIGLTWFDEGGLSERTIGHGSASSCTLRVDLEKDLVITMTRRTAGENFKQYHTSFIRAVTSNIAAQD